MLEILILSSIDANGCRVTVVYTIIVDDYDRHCIEGPMYVNKGYEVRF